MRRFGYTLLVVGFIWSSYFPLGGDPLARAASRALGQKVPQKQDFTRRDVLIGISDGAYEVGDIVQFGFGGAMLMLAGGIILGRHGRSAAVHDQPS